MSNWKIEDYGIQVNTGTSDAYQQWATDLIGLLVKDPPRQPTFDWSIYNQIEHMLFYGTKDQKEFNDNKWGRIFGTDRKVECTEVCDE